MAIATALRGFNNLLPETDFIYNDLHIVQKLTKTKRGKLKKSRFLSTGHRILPSFDCKVRETMVAKFELVLSGTSPVK